METYLNDDQRGHMQDLATLPRAEKCACGWAQYGQCYGRCYEDIEHGGATTAPSMSAPTLHELTQWVQLLLDDAQAIEQLHMYPTQTTRILTALRATLQHHAALQEDATLHERRLHP